MYCMNLVLCLICFEIIINDNTYNFNNTLLIISSIFNKKEKKKNIVSTNGIFGYRYACYRIQKK